MLGQCPSVGVGGFLLGGGVGPLMSKYGLGCDNVLAAELVLADGRQVKASAHENPDLYWAIRGGGGNFGIVTAFEVALHPVSKVFAGNITLESADPREFLRAFRDFLPTAPDELTLIALMSTEPNRKPQIEIQACYVGEQGDGEKALAPLRHHPAVVHDTIQSRPYLELEQMVPADIPPSYEEHCSGFFAELDDAENRDSRKRIFECAVSRRLLPHSSSRRSDARARGCDAIPTAQGWHCLRRCRLLEAAGWPASRQRVD